MTGRNWSAGEWATLPLGKVYELVSFIVCRNLRL